MTLTSFEWRPIRYCDIISIQEPVLCGRFCVQQDPRRRTTIVDGRARKKGYCWANLMDACEVLIRDHQVAFEEIRGEITISLSIARQCQLVWVLLPAVGRERAQSDADAFD